MQKIAIIGAGAWGTALSQVCRRAGRDVRLWVREADVAREINQRHTNSIFLPGIELDSGIRAVTDLGEAVFGAEAVLLVVPAQHLREQAGNVAAVLPRAVPAVVCAKGIERDTGALMSEVVAEAMPEVKLAVLSGPTFAYEVAKGLPTAVTLAAGDQSLAEGLTDALGTATFRPYASDDPIGAEIGGAVKNVLAIGCGIVEGRLLGDNARAALITRGLAEMTRLAWAKGGRPETLMGLSGLGDLTLTCNSRRSRNYSLGVALGEGGDLDSILASRRSVAEGVESARAVAMLAKKQRIDMPISAAVDAILHGGASIDATIDALLSRPFRAETVGS